MRPKGQRESRVHGSMQGLLRLLLIQITVFFAVSCAQETTNETGPTTFTKPTPTPTEPATTTLPPTTEETTTTETVPTVTEGTTTATEPTSTLPPTPEETTNETGPTTLTKSTPTPTEPATTTLPPTTEETTTTETGATVTEGTTTPTDPTSTLPLTPGPSPPTNLTVVEQGVGFATVRWTAPNDPNKDSYIYYVTCYQCGANFNFKTVYRTECDFSNLSPGNIYTVNVSSSNTNNKFSQPATITFTAVPCGGKLRAEGRLSSPDYPQNIYSNMHCVWDIEAPLGHIVLLTVVDLTSLKDSPSSQCDGSWLAVGYNQTSQRDITMCHDSEVGRTIISTSNMLRVFYNKTVDVNVVRFNVTLSSQDINECDNSTLCVKNADCINLNGTYNCTCQEGFVGNGDISCEDINECDNSTACVKNADCLNLNGTYNCTCQEGFVGNGDISCADIDECTTQNICGNHSVCLNVIGSYNCSCEKGYKGDPCMDVDECKGNNDCHSNATCSNMDGGHNCTCKGGFAGNGLVCTDVDECKGNNDCHSNATCSNTDGGHNCTCKGGFAGNGLVCTDVDECESCINDCDPNTTLCVNGIGNYLCKCRTGYENLSAGKCEDIDECKPGTSFCRGKNEICTNTIGLYQCDCENGYYRINNSCVGLVKKRVNLKMTATNAKYVQEMQNMNSSSYKAFVKKIENELIQSLKSVSPYFSKLVILNLTAS